MEDTDLEEDIPFAPDEIPSPPDLSVVGGEDDAPAPSGPPFLSDDHLASFWAQHEGQNWRYVSLWGRWYRWNGDGWKTDTTQGVNHAMLELCRTAVTWAKKITWKEQKALCSSGKYSSVKSVASSQPEIAATTDQWDADPWLLGVPGGVIDLRTGKMRHARHEDYITRQTSVSPSSEPPTRFLEFLDTMFAGKEEMISYVQRRLGECLTGITREQSLAFLYGTGQNGKGVLMQAVCNIMGNYARMCEGDMFMASTNNRHTTELAELAGIRLAIVDETDSSSRWNEARICWITGGSKIKGRFMCQDNFEFAPQFKLIISGNHKPSMRNVGKAMQRRFHMVPCLVTVPDHKRDNQLGEKLRAEYPQILGWMIQGCLKWQETGLKPPQEVVDATADYLDSEDNVGEFIDDCLEQSLKGTIERQTLFMAWKTWAEAREEFVGTPKKIFSALESRGMEMKKIGPSRYLVGYVLKNKAP